MPQLAVERERVLKHLSADIQISVTEIQYMLEFARAYPIYPSTGKLPLGPLPGASSGQ